MYGSINRNFSVRALTSNDSSAIESMKDYTAGLIGVSSIGVTTARLLERVEETDILYGFVLYHRQRGVLSYREYFYPGAGPLIVSGFYLEAQAFGRNSSRIDDWIVEYVFPEVTTLRIPVIGNKATAEASINHTNRWNGKTKTRRFENMRSGSNEIENPNYVVDISLV